MRQIKFGLSFSGSKPWNPTPLILKTPLRAGTAPNRRGRTAGVFEIRGVRFQGLDPEKLKPNFNFAHTAVVPGIYTTPLMSSLFFRRNQVQSLTSVSGNKHPFVKPRDFGYMTSVAVALCVT